MTKLFLITGFIFWLLIVSIILLFVIIFLWEKAIGKIWRRTYIFQWVEYLKTKGWLITDDAGFHELINIQYIISKKNFEHHIFLHKIHQILRKRIAELNKPD